MADLNNLFKNESLNMQNNIYEFERISEDVFGNESPESDYFFTGTGMIKDREIIEKLCDDLDYKRFKHTIGVAYTAANLAMYYGENVSKAYVAGLLHDCAKCISHREQIALCEKYNILLDEQEIRNPHLIHAKLGAFYASEKYNVNDEEIAEAIRKHTTGSVNMTRLEMIIFLADYIEPGRKFIDNLDEIRKQAYNSLEYAVRDTLLNTIDYLKLRNMEIHKNTLNAYEYYKSYTDD